MRSRVALVSAALLAANVVGAVGTARPAQASVDDIPINGTYIATYVGEWARVNFAYHAQGVMRSTWTVTSSCSTAQDCEGQVTSDQGWSASMYTHDGRDWYVKRDVPNWETCPDGTTFTGHETFQFYQTDMTTGTYQVGSPILGGWEKTLGPSGACGNNKVLQIDMPFRLDKIA